ncbi:Protein-tyrosine phosphatase-like [Trinorchestia longiramus]|nr:Protein-tyrosine phosphatase-like [Trinorchestia longiramus]
MIVILLLQTNLWEFTVHTASTGQATSCAGQCRLPCVQVSAGYLVCRSVQATSCAGQCRLPRVQVSGGYLVCRYMIQVMDMAPDQAIADFESARGHAQERDNYKEDLRRALWINEDPSTYTVVVSKAGRCRGGWRNGQWCKNLVTQAHTSPVSRPTHHQRSESQPSPRRGRGGWARRASIGGESSDTTPSSMNGSERRLRSRSSSRVRNAADTWRVTPTAAPSHPSEAEEATPRGRKRHRDRSESVSSMRGPWLPPCENSVVEPPRLRFKRAPCDTRYGGADQQRYDPYFYQQRQGGGPTRPERGPTRPERGPYAPISPHDGRRVNQYTGPRRYHTPSRQNSEQQHRDLVELENREPLSFPDDLPPRKGFLDRSRGWEGEGRGPGRNPRSPGAVADVFSPENTPRSLGRRRNRYEPY